MKKLKLWACLLAIFGSGFLLGFFVSGIHARHTFERVFAGGPPAAREMMVKKLTRELDLTPSQREHVDGVACRMLAEMFKVRRKHQPEVKALVDAGIAEMKQKLDPAQSKKLDEHFERVRHKWWGWREHPPGKDPLSECGGS
ncbi:MAG: hypothetical protein WAW37_17170 [Syntrophobacteraceae bacterium]